MSRQISSIDNCSGSRNPNSFPADSLVTGRSLQNGKMSMGNRRTERPPDPVLYGGRPSGGFVNRAVIGIRFSFLSPNVTDSTALGHGFVPSASDTGSDSNRRHPHHLQHKCTDDSRRAGTDLNIYTVYFVT